MKVKRKTVELIGWYGVTAILIAYASVSFSFLNSNNLIFQLLNLTGAIGIIYHSLHKKDYQPVMLNFIWALIAIFAILQIFI